MVSLLCGSIGHPGAVRCVLFWSFCCVFLAVILMEGGSEFDLQSLEEEYKFYQEEKLLTRQVTESHQSAADKDKVPEKRYAWTNHL